MAEKMRWEGTVVAVQPRILLSRSCDQQYHEYRGFRLVIDRVLSGCEILNSTAALCRPNSVAIRL